MFRKPKSKTKPADDGGTARNIRRRLEEEPESSRQPQSEEREREEEQPSENLPQISKPKHTGLSFNEEEDDDMTHFKLKKHSSSHKHGTDKAQRKQKALVERMEQLRATTKTAEVKKESETEKMGFAGQTATMGRREADEIVEEKLDTSIQTEQFESSSDAELRGAFPTAFKGIPDAKAVFEARKKREMLRQVGASSQQGGEFIPLDDTVRVKGTGPSGERARLIREDENDLSDEEETGSFYSAKKLLQNEEERRREEQAYFLELEQGGSDEEIGPKVDGRNGQPKREDSDEEEDELQRWEREQIRKGVSSNKVMQMQDELNATSMHFRGRKFLAEYDDQAGGGGEAEMDIDIDVEMLEVQQTTTKGQPLLPMDGTLLGSGKPPVSLEDFLEGLEARLAEKEEAQNSRMADLERTDGQLAENTELIHKLEHGMPQLEQKFRMFQDVRLYTRDLLDCLNEKIQQINALDERVMAMWKQRAEFLVARRRQDVQDQYQRCQSAAAGRPFTAPNAEFAQRETDREARRNRRRLQRSAIPQPLVAHYEGLSSDDEETPSKEVYYRDTIASAVQSAQDVFLDTEDDFCRIDQIMPHLLQWLAIDPRSFEDAYIPLCLPKLLSPFVWLQMLEWRPLKDSTHSALQSQPWYKQLLLAGLDNSGLDSLEHPVLVGLIPAVVEKIVLPKIARILREQWDPLSLSESINLATLLRTITAEYPSVNAGSKRMQEVLQQIHTKIRDALEHDIFVPLYSKEAIEAAETGCGAFLDRQFWKTVKLMRSILAFRGLLSDECLEELLMEGLVNRYAVMALQYSVLTSPTALIKCRALIELIPNSWLPPKRANSYRPLAMLLKQVIEIHRQKDRKFAEQAEKFVNLALNTSNVKQEVDEVDGNEDEEQ